MKKSCWLGGSLACALVLGITASGVQACSVGADPGVIIQVTGGGAYSTVDCAIGVVQVDTTEETSVGLKASPVDRTDATGCSAAGSWSALISSSGDGSDLDLMTVFGGSITELVDFFKSGKPGSTFSYFLSPNPAGVSPASGGATNFEAMVNSLAIPDIGGSGGSTTSGGDTWYVVGPNGPVTGMVSIDPSQVEITWQIRAHKGDVPAAYKSYAPASSVGYNPSVTKEQKITSGNLGGAQVSVAFDTPSFSGTAVPPPTSNRYAVFGEAMLPWVFDGVAIPLLIEREFMSCAPSPTVTPTPSCPAEAPCGTDCVDNGLVRDPPQPMTINFSGTVLKAAKPGDGEGHPSMALISVQDVTPPLAAETTPDGVLDSGGQAGQPLGTNSVTVDLWDNNPYGEAAEYEVEGWYLVERSTWENLDEFNGQHRGETDPEAYFAAQADDTWAANTEHKFSWVFLGTETASSVSQISVGGEPAGLRVTFPAFTLDEPLGVHYVTGASSAGMGSHEDYVANSLKFAYKIRQTGTGERPDGAIPDEYPATPPLGDWGGEMTADFTDSGGAVPAPAQDGVVDPSVVAAGPGDFGLHGVPTWDVLDPLPPSLVIIAHDLKYDRWYYFGDNFRAGAQESGGDNMRYIDAAFNGTASDHTQPNLTIVGPSAAGDVIFDQNDATTGYSDQIGAYLDDAGDFMQARDPRFSGVMNALWIDEDTRVEFFVTAWDNVNGWNPTTSGNIKYAGTAGAPSFTLVDDPSGVTLSTPEIHLFRNPNRPDAPTNPDIYVESTATDLAGNSTTVHVEIYVADNSLRIYSLEESRRRLAN